MKSHFSRLYNRGIVLALLALGSGTLAQSANNKARGSFNPEKLPASIDIAKTVHYVSVDGAFTSPSPSWLPCLHVLTGADHITEPITVGGHTGVRVMGTKFNNADDLFGIWANEHFIDILMQVYGDDALIGADGKPKYFNFLTGTLPDPIAVDSGELNPTLKNHKWNWVLFRIPNGLRHMDGGRLVGTINPLAKVNPDIASVSRLSGQNGGTIRMDGLHDLKVRFVAFGQRGAFGEPEQVNIFKR